jgi:hypothetical protein
MKLTKISFLLLFFGLLMGLCLDAEAQYTKQKAKKSKGSDPFLDTQWWLGVKAGANLTQVVATQRFSSFSSTSNPSTNFYDKVYENYQNPGAQAGLEITFFHKGFSFSFQPNYRQQNFFYSNDYLWMDIENPVNTLALKYNQTHHLSYLDFPLFIKYDFLRTRLRPFIQIGGYYSTLVNADKSVEVSGVDLASGGINEFNTEPLNVGIKDLFIKSSLGLVGGIGASYDIANIRITLDVQYRLGMNNITNAKNRYSNNRLASIGEAMDDLKMRNISASLGVLFPLRFLVSKHYRAN